MMLNVRGRSRTMRMNNRGECGGEGNLNVREESRTMGMNEGEGVRGKGNEVVEANVPRCCGDIGGLYEGGEVQSGIVYY
jgi:hypothetical protein